MAIKFTPKDPEDAAADRRLAVGSQLTAEATIAVYRGIRGRPLASQAATTNEATKPWEIAGMSRRTWYRRKSEKS